MSTSALSAHAFPVDAKTDEAAILALIQSLYRAHHEKSAAGIAAPYAHSAFIFDLEPPLSHDGISILRKEAWLATWSSPIDLDHAGFKLTVDGDHAYGHGFLRLTGFKIEAGRQVSFWMRLTVILERVPNSAAQWRIVHEHTSVPFYMDGSLRPAFDLQP
jgi:ketosteroid isomerase-like protein